MADKYLQNSQGLPTETEVTVVSSGPADGGKIVGLSSDGKLDLSVLPVATDEATEGIASSVVLGFEQAQLANDGQPGLTVLAVGFTTSGKVQGCSLGDGNVIEVYASGADFNSGTVLYREFMSLGEPICFTGLSNGAIMIAHTKATA